MQKLQIGIKEILSRECVMLRVFQEDDHHVKTIVVDYFSNIFKSNYGITNASTIVEAVQPMMIEGMNRG